MGAPSLSRKVVTLRITRLRAVDFRGWHQLDLRPRGHVLAIGEPRSGRSDLVEALRRVLDPRSTRSQPTTADIRQSLPGAPGSTSSVVLAPYAEVEVTLADLPIDLEHEADGALEPLMADGTADLSGSASPGAPLGLRLAYRVSYDVATDSIEHRAFYPILSDPSADKVRSRAVRSQVASAGCVSRLGPTAPAPRGGPTSASGL